MEVTWADLLLKAERYPNHRSAKLFSSLFHPGLQNHRITESSHGITEDGRALWSSSGPTIHASRAT